MKSYLHVFKLALAVFFLAFTGCVTKGSESTTQPGADSSSGPPAKATEHTKPPPLTEEQKIVDGDAYYVMCGGKLNKLENILQPIVDRMVAQKIPYTQDPANEWRDCSGNFLRLTSYFASECPEQQNSLIAPPGIKDFRPGGNNVGPGNVTARSSRSVAEWYQKKGRFTPIYYDGVQSPSQIPADLRKYRNLIRPGAVLWFSRGKPTSADGLDALFQKTSSGTHINHMGTVTAVKKNETGEVVSFEMFHGRTKSKPASVTRTHFWKWPDKYLQGGTKEYPSFGYWGQSLVGIATFSPVVTMPAAAANSN